MIHFCQVEQVVTGFIGRKGYAACQSQIQQIQVGYIMQINYQKWFAEREKARIEISKQPKTSVAEFIEQYQRIKNGSSRASRGPKANGSATK